MPSLNDPQERLRKLNDVLDGAKSLLIVMQNNPDPDAIAAAAALREIANVRHEIPCSLAHGGAIGRAENEALLRYMGLNTRSLESLNTERFDRVAVVDAQPGAGNLALPPEHGVDIVIDHHPLRRESRSAAFTDIRSRYGATSTMLYQYLRAAKVEIPTKLATALVYGIRSDTQDLGRESTKADVEAFLELYPLANPRILGRIVMAPLPRSYFSRLRRALDHAVIHGSRIVSDLGDLDAQEMIAEAADLLLRIEGVDWSLCLGRVGDVLHLSIRTSSREGSAGRVAHRLAGRKGYGGGHQTLAGVQIPVGDIPPGDPRIQRMGVSLVRRFLRATGTLDDPAEPLCAD